MSAFKTISQNLQRTQRPDARFLLALAMPAIAFCLAAPLRSAENPGENTADAAVSTEVKTALLYHLSFGFLVQTHDGVVTLSGSAADIAERDLNERIAAGINGVRRVINDMIIPAAAIRNN